MKCILAIALASASCTSAPASSRTSDVEEYLCTVTEKAGIAALHLEHAGPPEAFVEQELPTRFKIRISADPTARDRFSLVETDYSGPARDSRDYGTDQTVLHADYSGDGREFISEDDPSFFVFFETARKNEDGEWAFYHSGWEYPGGEDTTLAVRWGRCKPADAIVASVRE